MNSERVPLQAAPGLARTATLPPPPTRHPRPVAVEPAVGTPDPQPPTGAAQSAARSRAEGTSRRSAAARDAATSPRPVTLSLPASVVMEVKDRARADRVSQPDVLMDALSAAHDRLEVLLAPARTPSVSDGLFLRRRPQREVTDPMATLSMRLLAANLAVIDELVTRYQAPSRSALCAVALREYLGCG